MDILDFISFVTYKRTSVQSMLNKFLKSLPLKGNKKVRRTVANNEHWTAQYFKFRGTYTVSERVNDMVMPIIDYAFETQDKFISVVTDEKLWTGILLLSTFVAALFVESRQAQRFSSEKDK
jgi:hypothetical protein